ncbi:MAG TPA: patatin-like phospholipase family protein [Tepidisphaeraceae bacterium]|nr:patatin-like phospholipase family protein [Tepidisphaeraceae bacterium]
MRKVAIACQGGGSQTAFTAGVLRALFENGATREYEVVSLSGTSGGAICAALAWYGLLTQAAGDPTPIPERLLAF